MSDPAILTFDFSPPVREPWAVHESLMSFMHEGKTAYVRIVDGKVVYEGDLEVEQSARLLFDSIGQACIEGLAARQARS